MNIYSVSSSLQQSKNIIIIIINGTVKYQLLIWKFNNTGYL